MEGVEVEEKRKILRPNVSVYLGDTALYWEDFQKICRREGSSASQKISEFIEEYVSRHGAGNPQLVLPSFAEDGQQTIAGIEGRIRQVFYEAGKKDSNGVVYQDIVRKVRDSKIPFGKVVFLSDKVAKWLSEKGVKVWR
jgi:hypothetical protein